MAQQSVVSGVCTSVYTDLDGSICVVYRGTVVVRVSPDTVALNTGGWSTSTTKTRMNQAANQYALGYVVYQKDFEWFVKTEAGTFPFLGTVFYLDRETMKPREAQP